MPSVKEITDLNKILITYPADLIQWCIEAGNQVSNVDPDAYYGSMQPVYCIQFLRLDPDSVLRLINIHSKLFHSRKLVHPLGLYLILRAKTFNLDIYNWEYASLRKAIKKLSLILPNFKRYQAELVCGIRKKVTS